MQRQAVIRVGGTGVPLLQEVGGLPFLEQSLRHLARYGFRDVLLLSGPGDGELRDRYPESEPLFGVRLRHVEAPTAGDLRALRGKLSGHFLLLDAESFCPANLELLWRVAVSGQADYAVAVSESAAVERLGSAALADDDLVTAVRTTGSSAGRTRGAVGLYLLHRGLLELLPAEELGSLRELLHLASRSHAVQAVATPAPVFDVTRPEGLAALPAALPTPTLFFDRDGVLNVDHGYVHTIESFVWRRGAREALAEAVRRGYQLIVATNQSGIARGYYGLEQMHCLHDWMRRQLELAGAPLAAIYHCPHHPEGTVAPYAVACDCRKPSPGMLLQAIEDWTVDRERSLLFGDKPSDLEAARRAGVRGIAVTAGSLLEDVTAALEEMAAGGVARPGAAGP